MDYRKEQLYRDYRGSWSGGTDNPSIIIDESVNAIEVKLNKPLRMTNNYLYLSSSLWDLQMQLSMLEQILSQY